MTDQTSEPKAAGAGVGSPLRARIRCLGAHHLVALAGELDLDSGPAAIEACAAVGHRDVRVDLSGLTFMDCAGYDALAASASILEGRGGSVELVDPVGVPRRLLALLAESGRLDGPLRYAAGSGRPVEL